MSATASEQGRALRRSLWGTLARWTAIYVAVFLVACLAFELVLKDEVATYVADLTSDYIAVNAEAVDNYLDLNQSTRSHYEVLYESGDGTAIIRDLDTYYRIKAFKWPLAVALFFAGYVIVVSRVLARSIGFFEELSAAVAGIVRNRNQPVRLSPPLAIEQGELNEVREAALADESAAAEAERRKDELVAYLAHDIRTPLTSVVGYLSLLDEAPDLPEEQRRRYVATALEKAETLDTLTAEFFEITRYNLSSIPIERADVNVRFLLEQVADEFLPQMQEKALTAHVEAPEGATMRVDPDKMARALGNVVRNAIAYADTETVMGLSARRIEGAGWEIAVSDRGREIAPEHLESVFDRFFREDASRAPSGNAGLGLAIAREIVQAHGGSIRAASEGGVTTFTIELP